MKKIEPLLTVESFIKVRAEKQIKIMALKSKRRVFVGPYATFIFENDQTLWWQVHEMLRIENGGPEQLTDELDAYEPLIPQGQEWVATLMFEIANPTERNKILSNLGDVERKAFIRYGAHHIYGKPADDITRTNKIGKTSAVHFLRFTLTQEQIQDFSYEPLSVTLGIEHPLYTYTTSLPEKTLLELKKDLQTLAIEPL